MGQEFTINSSAIETKINQLLPSQGGFAPGVDFSASTTIIPIVDLTETAEGSQVRADLQNSLSLNTITSFNTTNETKLLIDTTGFFRIFGTANLTGAGSCQLFLTDGTTTKAITAWVSATGSFSRNMFDFIVFIAAGQELKSETDTGTRINCCTRQIADLDGNLTKVI